MSGEGKKLRSGRNTEPEADDGPVRTDGGLGDAKVERLKRPVNADAFLVDRPLSPEEEGLAGPMPEEDEDSGQSR